MPPADDLTRAAVEQLLDLAGERQARQILAEIGRRSAQQELERVVVLRLALRLLAERAPRWQVRDRLVSRGINERTAYRVIDRALDMGPRSCDTDTAPVSLDVGTLPAPQPPAQPVKTKHLQTRINELADKLAALDLPAARQRVETTKAERDRIERTHITPAPVGGPAGYVGDLREREQVQRAAKQAQTDLRSLETEEANLRREIANLTRLVTAEQRVATARQAVDTVAGLIASAQQQVQAAERAVSTIEAMVSTEERAYEADRAGAAAKLLAAVKAGADASAVPAATRDKVATLELAKVGAQQELEAARAALHAVGTRHAAALRDLRVAEADVAELAHAEALQPYVDTLAAYIAAHIRAHRQQPDIADPLSMARGAAQRLLETEAAS